MVVGSRQSSGSEVQVGPRVQTPEWDEGRYDLSREN